MIVNIMKWWTEKVATFAHVFFNQSDCTKYCCQIVVRAVFRFENDDILMNCRQRQRNMKCNCDFLTKVQLAILKDRLIFGNGKNPYWFLACCTHWDNSQRPILRSLIEPQSLAHSGLNSKWHVHPQWYYPLAVSSRSPLVPLLVHSLWTQLRVARASVLTTPHHRSVPTLGPSAREKLFTP